MQETEKTQSNRRTQPVLIITLLVLAASIALSRGASAGQIPQPASVAFHSDALSHMELVNAKAELVTYQERQAIHLVPTEKAAHSDESLLAIEPGSDFKDGTIEVEVAGLPLPAVDPGARGFIGIAFRVNPHASHFELFYLRPTNGRADDQLRRNHAVQYESFPDYPWHRLRKKNPGMYESYSDLEAGTWTKIKIVVEGRKAQFYVNGADQPCLIVNDLKLGDTRGQIALWAHPSTDAYFSELSVKKSN